MGRETTKSTTSARTDWTTRAIPRGKDPRELLAWLSNEDPLGVARVAQRRLARAAYLIDPERLYLRALARIALEVTAKHPPRGRGRLRWLAQLVDESVFELREEDRNEAAEGLSPASPSDPRYARIARELECDEAEARSICVGFNDLPSESRAVFHAVLVRQRSLEDAARELDLDLEAARERFEAALDALCPTPPARS